MTDCARCLQPGATDTYNSKPVHTGCIPCGRCGVEGGHHAASCTFRPSPRQAEPDGRAAARSLLDAFAARRRGGR